MTAPSAGAVPTRSAPRTVAPSGGGVRAGGTTAAQTLYDDRRIAAAVNLEGYLDRADGELFPVARYGVARPLLLCGTDGFRDARLDRSWSALLARPTGRTCLRRLDGADHGVFTDYAALVPQLHAAGLLTTADRIRLVGAIDPGVSVPTVRRLVRAFFTRTVPPASLGRSEITPPASPGRSRTVPPAGPGSPWTVPPAGPGSTPGVRS
ncbi:hypothetical protein AB0D99_05875 [Streptomyces sp. NPDC047971]|uniref:hypothetical protein n=1 Tax=Streptomyces sp. NPDC047971 TaxID=3154499 RepID=UPI0033DC72A1